ncbi:MAG: hypothetical protein R2711_16715 [Acidimicrobiales bacterium]
MGLTTGACLSHLGHRVVCADVVPEKVESLSRGEVPILEAGLDELVAEGIEEGACRSCSAPSTRSATPSSCSSACRRPRAPTAPPTCRSSRRRRGRSARTSRPTPS